MSLNFTSSSMDVYLMLLFVDIKLSFPGHEQLTLLQPYLAEEYKKELFLLNRLVYKKVFQILAVKR